MGEKEEIKVNLYVAVAIVLVIIFLIMGYYIFSINKSKKTLQIEKEQMQDKVSNLENQVSEYQNKIDTVMNVISNDTSSENTNNIKETNTTNNSNITKNKAGKKVYGEIEQESINLQKYVGEWYESKEHALSLNQNLNPNSLKIKSANGKQIVFYLYFTRTADFDNVIVSIENNNGRFEATTDNVFSSDGSTAKINGSIELNDNTIKLKIEKSNVQYLDAGKEVVFTYKE